MIKKVLIVFAILLMVLVPVLALQPASAVDILQGPCSDPNAQTKPEICKDNQTSATEANNPIFGSNGIITAAIRLLSLLIGIMAVIIIVVEGFRMVLAGGDANTAAQARTGIVWACVGLIVALLAQALVALVLNKL
ncbi:MAG: hypothetical protein ABWY71_00425 [Candidatus Saccharimonadales bacterium]